MQAELIKKWTGKIPERCDVCLKPLDMKGNKAFVDGKLKSFSVPGGPWAIMCAQCHSKHGIGIGLGKGQMYDFSGTKIKG